MESLMQRAAPRFAFTAPVAFTALLAVAVAGCGTTSTPGGGGVSFQGPPTGTDTGGQVDTSADTGAGTADAAEDTGAVDTAGTTDTAPADTGPVDTGPEDTAPVDTGPPQPTPCSFDTAQGRSGKECPDDQVCIPNVGACEGVVTGICKPYVQTCPTNIAKVCGCDGKEYDNACVAQKALVTVAADGACQTGPAACGGNTGGICPLGQICDPASCDFGAAGLCSADPANGPCPNGGKTECGCDDKTYPNVCYRLKAGVGKKQDGACPEPPDATLCKIGPSGKPTSCPAGTYCRLDDGNPIECTGDGVCVNLPPVCDQTAAPVCGCNFTTYPNACAAALASANVKFGGSCDGSCNIGSDECGAGKYCAAQQGQCSGKGTCIAKPDAGACGGTIDPVCGCNGKTYTSPACAAVDGVVPASKGTCPK